MNASDWATCREVIARHSRSFALASRLLAPRVRADASAVYAWCRLCDDAIDLPDTRSLPDRLAALRERLRSIGAGEPQPDPVGRCFQDVVQRQRVPTRYPAELLDGMEMDVVGARYGSVDDLLQYCWRVAGTVGLMMCHVMRVSDPHAARHGAHLGIAMQLTNICRDVREDWNRGRIYLPAELMSAGLQRRLADRGSELLSDKERSEVAATVQRVLEIAAPFYASADRGLRYLEPRNAFAVRTARLVYSEIGRVLGRRRYDAWAGRAIVPSAAKAHLVGRAALRFLAERRAWAPVPLTHPALLDADDAVRGV